MGESQSRALDQANEASAEAQANQPAQRPDEIVCRTTNGLVKAVIWSNAGETADGKPVRFKTASITNVYRDDTAEGGWAESNSFTRDDLFRLREVVDAAIQELCPTEIKRA